MIRDAKRDDLDAVHALWNHYIATSTANFRTALIGRDIVEGAYDECRANGYPFLVAEDDGFVGFAFYRQFRGGDGYARAMEHTIYLKPHATGHGVGGQLLSALKDAARLGGVHALLGVITAENTPSIAFHERHGFSLTAIIPEVGYKWGRYLDVAILQWRAS